MCCTAYGLFFVRDMQCDDCIKLSGTSTSTPAHTRLLPQGFKSARGASELTYVCKTCGTRWLRRVPAFGPGTRHGWTATVAS